MQTNGEIDLRLPQKRCAPLYPFLQFVLPFFYPIHPPTDMKLKQIIGIAITLLGMLCIGFGAYVLMMGETQLFGSAINRWEALVPFFLGLVFFGTGISLVRSA